MPQTLQQSSQDEATRRGLKKIYDAIVASRKIVVIAGAGISCSSGIPVSLLPKPECSDGLDSIGLSLCKWPLLRIKRHTKWNLCQGLLRCAKVSYG
jgi:hypothetical protein